MDPKRVPRDSDSLTTRKKQPSSGPRHSFSVLSPLPSGFLTRAFSGLRGRDGAEWGKRNGLTPSLNFSHNLNNVFPPELYKTHPEFFPLVEGKRLEPPKGSYFWNPDIARPDAAIHAAKVAREYFEKNPEAVSFALGVNDALVWGESSELRSLIGPRSSVLGDRSGEAPTTDNRQPNHWFRGRPDYSNVVFTFMNRAAEALSRTHPDKYLGALAYYWCENTPSFPLHPRVVPFLTADRAQGYDTRFWKDELDLQRRWGRLAQLAVDDGGTTTNRGSAALELRASENLTFPNYQERITNNERRLGLYDYLYGSGFIVPRIHTSLIAASLRHAHRAGFTDYYAEVNPNWGLDGPMPWLVAQLLQDPEQSHEALIAEYYERYFQEAAEPMRRFFEKCEELWMAQPGPPYWLKHFRNESQAILFPPDARAALRLMLAEAEALARSTTVKERVRLVSEAFGVTERFCVLQEARERVMRLLVTRYSLSREPARLSVIGESAPVRGNVSPNDGKQITNNDLSDALSEYLENRRDFIRYTASLRAAQPLALHPVNHDDFLRNNPGFMATIRILEEASGREEQDRGRMTKGGRQRAEEPGLGTAAQPRIQNSELRAPSIAAAIEYFDARAAGRLRELLPAGSFEGPWMLGRRIAGMQYGVDMPSPWQSRLEPTETHVAILSTASARTGVSGLRISGAVNSTVYQWIPITGGRTFVASVFARAKISPSHASMLTLGWLDAQQRHIGAPVVIRIPDGEWPEWIHLMQGTRAPENATWAGVAIRVQNQLPGDWVEFDDFSLVEVTP